MRIRPREGPNAVSSQLGASFSARRIRKPKNSTKRRTAAGTVSRTLRKQGKSQRANTSKKVRAETPHTFGRSSTACEHLLKCLRSNLWSGAMLTALYFLHLGLYWRRSYSRGVTAFPPKSSQRDPKRSGMLIFDRAPMGRRATRKG